MKQPDVRQGIRHTTTYNDIVPYRQSGWRADSFGDKGSEGGECGVIPPSSELNLPAPLRHYIQPSRSSIVNVSGPLEHDCRSVSRKPVRITSTCTRAPFAQCKGNHLHTVPLACSHMEGAISMQMDQSRVPQRTSWQLMEILMSKLWRYGVALQIMLHGAGIWSRPTGVG